MQYEQRDLSVASRVEAALSVVGPRPKVRRSTARTALRDAREAWFAGDWERAIARLTGAELQDRGERVEAAFLLARAALRAGQPARALVALDESADQAQGPD